MKKGYHSYIGSSFKGSGCISRNQHPRNHLSRSHLHRNQHQESTYAEATYTETSTPETIRIEVTIKETSSREVASLSSYRHHIYHSTNHVGVLIKVGNFRNIKDGSNSKEICSSLPVMRKVVVGSQCQMKKLSEKIKPMKDANDKYKVVKLTCAYIQKNQ